VATVGTTISCRASALTAALLLILAARSTAAGKVEPPRLPVAIQWSVALTTEVATAPVSDGDRIFLALRSAHLVARAIADGRELWRIPKNVVSEFAVDAGLLFVASGDAIEALRATDGASVWTVPRVTTAVPLLAAGGFVFAVTTAEILAIRAQDGGIVWRHAAGGVRQPPAIDGDRLYLGAEDGRIVALDLATGAARWEKFVEGGVTALAARRGLVYAGAGNKHLYCLDARNGAVKWPFRVGALITGHIAVDDERVYFAALDNLIRAVDRSTGNQRWKTALKTRPISGVRAVGHVLFVAVTGTDLVMLFDRDGERSGTIALPGDTSRDTPPAVQETASGLHVFMVTGGLSNAWALTYVGPAGELPPVPFSAMTAMPGANLLTDPVLAPIGQGLSWMVLGDPLLQPLAAVTWPVLLRDPPLEPLTILPGLQLRPLSPVLPARRGV